MNARRKMQWIVRLAVVVVVAIAGMTAVDFRRAKSGKRPIFSFQSAFLLDGGTTEYVGPFYSITFHQTRSILAAPDGLEQVVREHGPEFTHWFLPLTYRDVRTDVIRD